MIFELIATFSGLRRVEDENFGVVKKSRDYIYMHSMWNFVRVKIYSVPSIEPTNYTQAC